MNDDEYALPALLVAMSPQPDRSMQSKGGYARAKAMTAQERSDCASKAAKARWSPGTLKGNEGQDEAPVDTVTISLTFDVLPYGFMGGKSIPEELENDINTYFIHRPNMFPEGEGAGSHLFTKFRNLAIRKKTGSTK